MVWMLIHCALREYARLRIIVRVLVCCQTEHLVLGSHLRAYLHFSNHTFADEALNLGVGKTRFAQYFLGMLAQARRVPVERRG